MKENDNIFLTFVKYATLNALGMLGLSCYILADTFFIARGLGPDGLASLNLSIPIYSFIHGSGLMIGMGGATRYSILKGNVDRKNTDSIFMQSVTFALLFSALFLLIGVLFSEPLSGLLGADAALHQMTSTYLKIILIFTPMFMLNNVLLCFVRNDQNPKLSMLAMLVGSFSNIVLDYLFIFPLKMGMFGAALATGVAPIISMLILLFHFIQKKNSFRPIKTMLHIEHIKDILSLGVSSFITEASSGVVMVVFNVIILGLQGNLGVAAYGIIANVSLVFVAIFTGIAQGIQPIISSNYGCNHEKNVIKTYRYAIVTAIFLGVVLYGFIYCFAHPLVGSFNRENDVELTAIAVNGLYIYFTAFIFVGVNVIKAAYFNAIDKPKQAFIISMLRGFVLIIPISFLMSNLFGMNGVWLSFPLSELITAVISFFFECRARKSKLEALNQ